MSAEFLAGERAMLLDRKGRRYLVTLRAGKQFHTHAGFLEHDRVIGFPEGSRIAMSGGGTMVVVRPSFSDFVLKMPRGAQVVYPKDIAAIVMGADIYPGARVLEAGTGSGALTLGLLRAVGERGTVITYESRPEFAERARMNIESFWGDVPPTLVMCAGDVTDAVLDAPVDRIVLDLPEPWHIIPLALRVLRPGGVFCSYVPSTVQVSTVTEALRAAGFIDILTTETLVRSWHVEGLSVRPDHRMVAHTGFVTVGRFLGEVDAVCD